jgi:hypothetical protein
VRGKTFINGKEVDPTKSDFTLVPTANISKQPFRVSAPKVGPVDKQMIDDQETFRKKVRRRDTGDPAGIPEDITAIQPRDQKYINHLTGVKSPIPEPTMGTDAHHILPKSKFPGLRTNVNNGISLSNPNHVGEQGIHKLNNKLLGAKIARLRKSKLKLMKTKLAGFFDKLPNTEDKGFLDRVSKIPMIGGADVRRFPIPKRDPKFKDPKYLKNHIDGGYPIEDYLERVPEISEISDLMKSKTGDDRVAAGEDVAYSFETDRMKKKLARLKSQSNVTEGMIQLAKNQSADSIMNAFATYKSNHPDSLGSGVYDPVENRILDARIPLDAIRLQRLFEAGTNKIGFNSITDTRQSPATDTELIRSQLKEIEQAGGIPALGFDEGSLEALDVVTNTTDDEILTSLRDSQRSTGILDADLTFRILDSPKFRRN